MISYKEFDSSYINRVKEIYALEGWTAYLNSDEKLVRFVRCVGDGELRTWKMKWTIAFTNQWE